MGPVNKIELYVIQFNNSVNESEAVSNALNTNPNLKSLLGDLNAEWIYIKDNYIKIDILSYPGFTNIQKFELFLAHYSSVDFIEASKKVQICKTPLLVQTTLIDHYISCQF